jgi:uncharacterized paraquat-inducible protein A
MRPETSPATYHIAMICATTDRARLRAGNTLFCFGCVAFAGSIVAAFLLDALTIDLTAIVAIWLGSAVRRGSRRAMKWAFALVIYYVVLSAALLTTVLNGRAATLRISGRSISEEETAWLVACMVAVFLWSLVNALFLRQALHEEKREARRRSGFCVTCGYDLTGNTTGRCPECGAPIQNGDD